MNNTLTQPEIYAVLNTRKKRHWRPAKTARIIFYVGALVFILDALRNGPWNFGYFGY